MKNETGVGRDRTWSYWIFFEIPIMWDFYFIYTGLQVIF